MLHSQYGGMMWVLQPLLPVVLISDCLGRIVGLHRGKDTATHHLLVACYVHKASSITCAVQSKQHHLCCALFSLSTEHSTAP